MTDKQAAHVYPAAELARAADRYAEHARATFLQANGGSNAAIDWDVIPFDLKVNGVRVKRHSDLRRVLYESRPPIARPWWVRMRLWWSVCQKP